MGNRFVKLRPAVVMGALLISQQALAWNVDAYSDANRSLIPIQTDH